jgi:hypothetical protein
LASKSRTASSGKEKISLKNPADIPLSKFIEEQSLSLGQTDKKTLGKFCHDGPSAWKGQRDCRLGGLSHPSAPQVKKGCGQINPGS